MHYRISFGALAAIFAVALASAAAAEPDLSWSNYEKWRDFIDVKSAEIRCVDIPWRTHFWAGLIDAQKENKPLLLWIYNGDPLGSC